jgi:hypothetical protein
LAQQQQRAKYAADRRLALAKERGRRDFIPRKRRKAQVAKFCERLQDAKDEPKAASDATKRRKRMKRRETTQRRGLTEKRQTEKEKRRRTMEEEEEEGSSSSIVKGWRREEVPGKEEILALEILVPGKEEILVLEKIK